VGNFSKFAFLLHCEFSLAPFPLAAICIIPLSPLQGANL